jgi:hypothetical protein
MSQAGPTPLLRGPSPLPPSFPRSAHPARVPPAAQLHRRPVPALPLALLSRTAHPAWPAAALARARPGPAPRSAAASQRACAPSPSCRAPARAPQPTSPSRSRRRSPSCASHTLSRCHAPARRARVEDGNRGHDRSHVVETTIASQPPVSHPNRPRLGDTSPSLVHTPSPPPTSLWSRPLPMVMAMVMVVPTLPDKHTLPPCASDRPRTGEHLILLLLSRVPLFSPVARRSGLARPDVSARLVPGMVRGPHGGQPGSCPCAAAAHEQPREPLFGEQDRRRLARSPVISSAARAIG